MESTKFSSLFAKWLDGLVDYLIVFPILLLVGIPLGANLFYWVVSIPLLFILGTIFGWAARGRKKGIYLGFALLISAVYAFFSTPILLHRCFLLIVAFISLFRGNYYGSLSEEDIPTKESHWIIGFPIYVIAYFLFRHFQFLSPYLGLLTASGIFMVIVTLIVGNRDVLSFSNPSTPSVSGSIKRKNVFLLAIAICIIGIFSAFQSIEQGILHLMSGAIRGFLWLMSLFGSKETVQKPEIKKNLQMPNPLTPAPPSKFAQIMDHLVHFIVYIGLVAFALWLIYVLSKNLRKWVIMGFRNLIRQLNAFFRVTLPGNVEMLGYVDEKESLIPFDEWGKWRKGRLKGAFRNFLKRQPKWKDLKDEEKIRYTYRQVVLHYMKQGFSYKPVQTPNETLLEVSQTSAFTEGELNRLTQAYEKVRYGHRSPSEDELTSSEALLSRLTKKE